MDLNEQLDGKRERLSYYYKREREMLDGGVQSYSIGTRSLTRYTTELREVRTVIKALEEEVAALEGMQAGRNPRRSVGVVIRDW